MELNQKQRTLEKTSSSKDLACGTETYLHAEETGIGIAGVHGLCIQPVLNGGLIIVTYRNLVSHLIY